MHDDITDVRLLWSQLTPAERSCVLEYHTCGVKVKAARRAGKNQKWLEYHQKAHPLFRQAMDECWSWPGDVMMQFAITGTYLAALGTMRGIMASPDRSSRIGLDAAKAVITSMPRQTGDVVTSTGGRWRVFGR